MLRLLNLTSPALPIGGFHFSQGLEDAVEHGLVHDAASSGEWIAGLAEHAIGTLDLPLLLRLHAAWTDRSPARARRLSARLIAARETAELRAEDRHLGTALARVLVEHGINEAKAWIGQPEASHAALFALAAVRWDIGATDAATGYLWSWCENQVLAAIKLVPLGQNAGQRLIGRLIQRIPDIVDSAAAIDDDDIGIASPMQGIASARHETQYSRLFRS
ncbi:MAG: urease accessory protein UreF [Gammaproteobacteria bacterium]|uniref:urease accessory protein UreF n=1 Tax=Nevskia sp. TaxID=1929292 RepID=UPI004035FD86|nr:urease accessory protein UreF [Gammaproteobacteria bacterium]